MPKVSREQLVNTIFDTGVAATFIMAEDLAEAGITLGLERDVALKFARATIIGAGTMLTVDQNPVEALRKHVTGPGGATEHAARVLMRKNGLRSLMIEAVSAAHERALEIRRGVRTKAVARQINKVSRSRR